jgi:hypothetical protein
VVGLLHSVGLFLQIGTGLWPEDIRAKISSCKLRFVAAL